MGLVKMFGGPARMFFWAPLWLSTGLQGVPKNGYPVLFLG